MVTDIQTIKKLSENERRAWLHELLDSFTANEAWGAPEKNDELKISEDVVELLLQRQEEVKAGKQKPVSVESFKKAMLERFGEKWQKH